MRRLQVTVGLGASREYAYVPGLRGVFFSVALSVASPRPAVSRYSALWSPDFPHRYCLERQQQRGRLAYSILNCSIAVLLRFLAMVAQSQQGGA